MIYIGIIGESSCSEKTAMLAYQAGAQVARAGAVLVTGGLCGVMECACKGAKEAGGVTLGILPGGDRLGENRYLDYSVPTGLGEARNSVVVRCSDALLAIGGSYGTLSEIAFALRFGKPVVGLETWRLTDGAGDSAPIFYEKEPESAVKLALNLVEKRTNLPLERA